MLHLPEFLFTLPDFAMLIRAFLEYCLSVGRLRGVAACVLNYLVADGVSLHYLAPVAGVNL